MLQTDYLITILMSNIINEYSSYILNNLQEEAEFGKYLTEQINNVSAQNRIYEQVNDDSIIKIEEANMATMKNIQRLAKAVRQHEGRISTMKQLLSRQNTLDTGAQFFHL